MAASKCRQNYQDDSEAAINKQINIELYAQYSYLAMAAFYDRDDVALKGFAKFFRKCAHEEGEHADKFVRYQNLRGGRVVFQAVDRPAQDAWDTPLAAMENALNLEHQVNQALLDMHKLASTNGDPHLTNFIEEEYLKEQAEAMNKLAKYVTNLQRVGPGLGVYIFDQELQC